jgi:hypothetical protein
MVSLLGFVMANLEALKDSFENLLIEFGENWILSWRCLLFGLCIASQVD